MTTASAAWANRATAMLPMLHIGDSVTEGTKAGGFEAKWTTKLLRSLQADAGITGGPGWVNSGTYVNTDNSMASFWNPVGSTTTSGLLGNKTGLFGTSNATTLSFTGTAFSLHFFQGFGGAQPMTVTIDGGAANTVTVPTTGGANNRGVWTSPTLTAGTHTAVIAPTTGQQLSIRGVHIYNGDQGKGVHGWEGAHYGSTAAEQSGAPTTWFQDACAVIQPAVVTLFLGLNDRTNNTAGATYQTYLSTIISAVNSYCTVPPSWVVCGIYAEAAAETVPLADYTAAAQAVVNADAVNRRFVDLSKVSIPLDADGVHPTPTGHAAIATAIRPAVLDLAGASAPVSNPFVVRSIV